MIHYTKRQVPGTTTRLSAGSGSRGSAFFTVINKSIARCQRRTGTCLAEIGNPESATEASESVAAVTTPPKMSRRSVRILLDAELGP